MKCKTCKFWDVLPNVASVDSAVGTCRINPPVIIPTLIEGVYDIGDVLVASHQPVTLDKDWCGKHEIVHETTENE